MHVVVGMCVCVCVCVCVCPTQFVPSASFPYSQAAVATFYEERTATVAKRAVANRSIASLSMID